MSGRIRTFTITVTTTGAGGAATGSSATTEYIEGYLEDLYINYHASAPGTTDIIVKQTDRTENLYAKTNSATDVHVAPRMKAVDNAAAAITDSHARFPINGTITVSLAESDALTGAVVVTARVNIIGQ